MAAASLAPLPLVPRGGNSESVTRYHHIAWPGRVSCLRKCGCAVRRALPLAPSGIGLSLRIWVGACLRGGCSVGRPRLSSQTLLGLRRAVPCRACGRSRIMQSRLWRSVAPDPARGCAEPVRHEHALLAEERRDRVATLAFTAVDLICYRVPSSGTGPGGFVPCKVLASTPS
jgi:hypothetical protein